MPSESYLARENSVGSMLTLCSTASTKKVLEPPFLLQATRIGMSTPSASSIFHSTLPSQPPSTVPWRVLVTPRRAGDSSL